LDPSKPPVPAETALFDGDVVCLFTDGFLECRNPTGELLGRKKARRILQEAIGAAPKLDQAMADIYLKIDKFRSNHPLEDDISFLLVKRAA
ncbi:hypothetical protein EBR21_09545, partial [bacterium]|nr:hypothetical protein [bacterium]